MAKAQSLLKSALGAKTRERREAARFAVHGVTCDRGRVIDLTARGMRLATARRWREGQRRAVTIAFDESRLTVDARCIWCRQDSMFSHVLGLAFDALTPEQEAAMARVASSAAVSEA